MLRSIAIAMSIVALPIAAPALAQTTAAAPESTTLAPGDGHFRFSGWAGPEITVYYHMPATVSATTPVVFVMHGTGRDADRYLREWSALAESNGFIAVVPQFDKASFPGSESYNWGGFRAPDGTLRPREKWTFAAIEPLFDEVKRRTGTTVPTYAIYGHSAGAQFVHRFVWLTPNPRANAIVPANAGSYAMPDFTVDFPFGLQGAPVDEAQLKRALGMPVVVLLGTADIDPNHKSLPRQPEAMAQGPYRLARGKAFFAAAKAQAERLKTPFRWQLRYADGVAHSNGGMAKFAAPLLAKGFGTAGK